MSSFHETRSFRPKLRRAAVYEYLVRDCLNLYVDSLSDIERVWGLDREDVDRLGIVSCPSEVGNIIGAGACAQRFGELFDVPGFYRCSGCWWLDLDARLARRGLIVPVRDSRWPSLMSGLRIFRHVRDQRPFILRVRAERREAA